MSDQPSQTPPASASVDEARATRLYESSQTFLLRTPAPQVYWLRRVVLIALLLFFFIAVPVLAANDRIPAYKINLLGQYLCFAIVALGIDLVWGYTGLLSLCQALFFALGGYAMGMHLSLPEGGGTYAYPQFMEFAYPGHGHQLPAFWVPFRHFGVALAAGILVPGVAAALFGFLILRSRVRGVYFSIITQALAAAAWLLISRNEMLLGGSNGLTNFCPALTQERKWIVGLYLLTLTMLSAIYALCQWIVKSRLGRVLVAVRDKETRLYFAGYQPHAFKVFAFTVGAMIAGVGGMLYSAQMTIINPQNMDVRASIVLVVMVALGGRGKLWGAVFGALLLAVAQSSLTSDFSDAWLLVLGLIAVMVVLFFPDGFAGLWDSMERQLAGGQGFLRAAITAMPLAAIALFIASESLGLTPRALMTDAAQPQRIAAKYWLLIGVLAAAAGLQWWSRRNPSRPFAGETDAPKAPVTAREA